MISAQPEYKPGDPVWIKIERCPWWPSLVVAREECPVVPRSNSAIIACIHFTPEEEYDIIYSHSKILPWEKDKNGELMVKALRNLKNKESMKNKFMEALASLEKRCEIEIPKISKSQLRPKPCYYQVLDQNKKCGETVMSVPKPPRSIESSDHNHKQEIEQKNQDNLLKDVQPATSQSGKDSKKRSPDSAISTNRQPAKKAKPSPRKSLAKDLDSVAIKNKGQNSCPWDTNLEKDECDSEGESDGVNLVPLPLSQPERILTTKDENREDDSDSDDEDLPDVMSSCTKDPVMEGTLLWVKIGKWPFWPAIVKKCYRRKKVLQKVTLVFIGDIGLPSENSCGPSWACLRYNKKNMMAFADQERHNQLKEEGLKSEYGRSFHEAVSKTEDFLFKKCLGNASCPFAFFAEEISHAIGGPDPLLLDEDIEDTEDTDFLNCGQLSDAEDEEATDTAEENLDDSYGDSQSSSEDVTITGMDGGSAKLQIKKQKRRERADRIIQMIKTPKFKEYLVDIYEGKRNCERHNCFISSSHRERVALRNHGFGPIDDEDQQMALVTVLSGYMKELCGDKMPNMAYIFDVWVPETIIHAMQKVAKKTREVVEQSFFRGPLRTKEEKKIQHEEMMETTKNIDPEDMERYRAKLIRVQDELFNKIQERKSLTEQNCTA